MKLIKVLSLVAFVGLMIAACTKEKIVTKKVLVNTAPDSLGLILAGAKGSSRSWKMTAASFTQNGGAANSISLASCVLDNIFKFTNNSTQDFIQNEGAVKCNSPDSTITEQGNWAITDDGKNLVVSGFWFDDLNAESEFLFTFTTQEAKIVSLSDTTLVVNYSFPYTSNGVTVTIAVTVIFTKV
jgi:hypothetical protein